MTHKFISAAALLLLLPLTLGAQKKLYEPVTLSINSTNGQFAKGETVNVYAELSEDRGDALHITVTAGSKKVTDEALALKVGEKTLIHTAAWDEAKSVMVKVFSEADPKAFTAVGYIVAPEEFTPGYEEPADLMKYWENQIAKMRKSKMKVKSEAVTEEYKYNDKVNCYSLEINMPQGNPVRAYVAVPKEASAKSLPIYIFTHSAGVKSTGNRSTVKKAVSLARSGAIAIDINAHGMLNDQPQEYYDELNAGELKNYSTVEPTTRDEYYFKNMYLRLVRALDYLVTLPEWDGERVLVYGESQGGGQAAALAGIDSRVTAAVMIVPALNDLGGAFQKRPNGWPVTKLRKKVMEEPALSVLPYFDGALLIKYSKAKLFYEAGLVDTTCNPACVFASYNNASSTDKQIHTYPYRPHSRLNKRYNEEWSAQVEQPRRQFIKNYIKKGK